MRSLQEVKAHAVVVEGGLEKARVTVAVYDTHEEA